MDRKSHICFWEGFFNGAFFIACIPGIVFTILLWPVIDYLVFISGEKVVLKEAFKFKALSTVVVGALFAVLNKYAFFALSEDLKHHVFIFVIVVAFVGFIKFISTQSNEEY